MFSARRLIVAFAAALALGGAASPPAEAIIYWANDGGNSIGRANNDGSAANPTFITGLDNVRGVAVNGTHIYWVNVPSGTLAGSIGRARLDGTDVDPNLVPGISSSPGGIALDATYVYWANSGADVIGRAMLDGSAPSQNHVTFAGSPGVSAVAVQEPYLYWTAEDDGVIGRVPLANPSATEPNFINTGGGPAGIAIRDTMVFWGNFSQGRIGSATLNGTGAASGVDPAYIGNAFHPVGVALDGTYVYWANRDTGAVARATHDRNVVQQNFIAGVGASSGVAVDGLTIPTPPGPGPPGTNPGPPPRSAVVATMSALSQTNPTFRVGRTSTPLTGRATRTYPRGTTFSLRLDQAASITVRIQRKFPGRRVGRSCRRPTRPLRNRPRCTRLSTKVTLRRTARAGRNRIAFTGRIRRRALAPGRYRAAFTATNTAGTSRLRVLNFRIVAG